MSLSDGLMIGPKGSAGLMAQMQERERLEREAAQQRQVQSASVRSLLNTQGVVGTPGTMGFEVNGRQYGQDTAATPLVSRETQLGNVQRAAPDQFNAAAIQSALASAFPKPLDVKDRYLGTPGEGGVFDLQTQSILPGTRTAKAPPAEVQTALFQAGGDMNLAREILAANDLNGEWALNKSTGQPEFITPQELIRDRGRSYTKPPSGMRIESDGKGGFTMTTGDGGGSGFGKPAQNLLEENYIKAGEGYARLQGIQNDFRPEFQQLGTRWSALGTAIKDKAGLPVPDADRQQLEDYSAYRSNAIDNISQYIKDITGAAASAQEMERITKGMPNPGQSLFDGDSPIEFQAKMNSTMKRLASVQARMAYARANGMDQQKMLSVPLDDMPGIINRKGNELRDRLKRENPDASPSSINEMVKNRLRQEFGLQ